jgi:hypothetical protein
VCATDGEDVAEEGVIEIAEGAQTGSRATLKMADPVRPSVKEVEEHELTHLPFRNWCRECVHGRGVEMPHKRQTGGEDKKLMELHCDYMFLGP